MNRFRPILATALIFLILMSGSSFIVGLHLCGGSVQNVALFKKADGCEKEKQLPPCHRQMTKPCCEDEQVLHEGQGFNNPTTQINIDIPYVGSVVHSPVVIAEILNSAYSQIQFYNYDPPLRSCDLTVSFQVFLI